jgi:choline dehydrogenase-like flavoprotein
MAAGVFFRWNWNDPIAMITGREDQVSDADLIIVGSGMGGATLAAGLAPTGKRILILERGQSAARLPEARDPVAIFARGHFRPAETG